MTDDVGALGRTLSNNLALALELSQQASAVADTTKQLVGEAVSADGAVSVSVDYHGFITDLRFADSVLDGGIGRVGALVMETTSRAIADLQLKSDAVRSSLVTDPRVLIDTSEIERQLDDLVQSVLDTNRPAPDQSTEGWSWRDTK